MDIQLDDKQRHAADAVVRDAERDGLCTLGGYAGTGKTTILSYLYRNLRGWKFVAFTGKAASNLRKKGVEASTIHSAIYHPIEKEDGKITWELKDDEELGYCRGFAIDEASMVGSSLLRDLQEYGRPIIAVGDHGQLPPVKDDAGLMIDPNYTLETIHRNAGPIAAFAEWLREGNDPGEWRGKDREGVVRVVSPKEIKIADLIASDQVITAYNADRERINTQVRWNLGRKGSPVAVGDRVVVLRNSREYGVYNGQQGVVTLKEKERSYLTIDTGCSTHKFPFTFDLEDKYAVPISYAYCVTCHKAQGDEFDNVIVFEGRPNDLWPHNKWTYTAASRVKKDLTWVLPK